MSEDELLNDEEQFYYFIGIMLAILIHVRNFVKSELNKSKLKNETDEYDNIERQLDILYDFCDGILMNLKKPQT